MKKYNIERNINFSIMSQSDIEIIHEKSLEVLERIGMKISGDRMLKLLKDAGAIIDGEITKIPRELVLKALKSVPKEVIIYNRDGEPHIICNDKNNVYFGTHADQLEIIDPYTGKARKFLKKDTELMCKIADFLPNIDFVLSVGLSSDIDPKVQSQVSFIETVKNFSKPINFSTNDIESVQEIIDIAAIVAGGKEKLREKPFIFNYCEPIPPLTHPIESTEKLYVSAENKIPVVYMPYCMMGGTSPIRKVETLIQCNSELLCGIVMTQLVNEGAPFIYGAMPSVFDMKTSVGSYAAPEFHLMIAAASEMADFYGVPFYGTAASSDSKSHDAQLFTETSYEIMSTLLSKANIVHDVGITDHCNSVSPISVVIANETIEMLKHYSKGLAFNHADINLSFIEEVGHGGHYLNTKQTLKNFKSIWYPEFFSRKMKNPDDSEVIQKAIDKIKYIYENHKVQPLDEAILDKLNEIQKKYEDSVK